MSLHVSSSAPCASESFSLVLRASRETNIVLSTGQQLADVDVHFTLFTKWKTGPDLDQDLENDDVGFLAHIEGERGAPFVHGGALLLSKTVVAALLCVGTHGKVKATLPTVPFENRKDAPYIWGTNKSNMLRISHLEISATRSKATKSDA